MTEATPAPAQRQITLQRIYLKDASVEVPQAPQVSGRVDDAILAYADEIDARLIVLGSRGRSSAGYALLGDVAHDILQRADRPVLVVPSRR